MPHPSYARGRALHIVLLAILLSPAVSAQIIQDDSVKPPKQLPPLEETRPKVLKPKTWIVPLMIRSVDNGMLITLPVVDTSPNRGTTYGIMPIWVINGNGGRIRHIFAPSVTYNETFRWEPTWRYYYYPTDKASYFVRGNLSGNVNKDLIGTMEDLDFLGRGIAVSGRIAYDWDGSRRFYGIGPNTQQADETNYLRKTIGYFWRVGLPIFRESKWKFNFAHRLSGEKIDNGVFDDLPGIRDRFPGFSTERFHQDSEFQLFIDYDTRDSALTTSEGTYLKFLIENAQRGFGGEFAFQRYAIDLRHFHRWDDEGSMITALRYRFEQVLGDAPFYLLPSLGGRTIHRAYGRGRYIDKGLTTVVLEQRIIVHKIKVAGVTTELELTPFMGLGTVFPAPRYMSRRYMRPVFGGAVRAIARPQVVGSIDIGVGQEGPAVFMDINYSF